MVFSFFPPKHDSALELALVVGPVAAFVVLIFFVIIIAAIVIVTARRYRGQFAVTTEAYHACAHTYTYKPTWPVL